ncbi:MAG TPA: iron-sulfur cluster assembly scaffold protein NifU, partial [Gammaproteobacteria bacterium]|nr:iron-sulfur cluster assembly scaffold protein NifU [Gammaproteobacteria bacterium]
ELAARGEVFTPAGSGKKKQAAKKSDLVEIEAPAPAAASGGMTLVQRIRKIEEVLEALRPALKADNGDVELVDVDGKVVYVNLVGACSGCQMAAMTLGGIQQKLIEALGEFIKVIPASERPAVA